MSFQKYGEYRDSGVDWIGPVPAHWSVAAVAYRYQVLLGKMLDEKRISGQHLAPYLRNADVQWDEIKVDDLPKMDFSGDDLERYLLIEGDLLVCEGGEPGRAAIWRGELRECYYQKALHRLRRTVPSSDSARFMFYLLRMATGRGVFVGSEGKSTIAHLTAESLRRYRFAFPPPEEQQSIVQFLDAEAAKIDTLVKEQAHLIGLLQDKRRSTTALSVTKGLTSTVPLKDSGVDWLGRIPSHWQTSRLANLFSDTDQRGSDELPVLTVSIHDGVSDEELDEEALDRKVTRSDDKTKYKRVAPGDLVYNMMRAWQGGFGSVTVDGMVSPAYVVARPRTMFPTSFIERVLRTPNAIEEMRGRSRGVTDFRLRLYWEEFKDIVVPLPPKDEVEAIMAYLDESDRSISDTISAAEDCMSIMRERRSALISAAVTGKIDVRTLAAERASAT